MENWIMSFLNVSKHLYLLNIYFRIDCNETIISTVSQTIKNIVGDSPLLLSTSVKNLSKKNFSSDTF